jgi:glutathione S-transferase
MSLLLHMHPLSSYCHKVLTALYELEVPFEPKLLDLGNERERQRFYTLWPIGKMPLLVDEAAGVCLPESTIIIDYLNERFGGTLIPSDHGGQLEVRAQDRFFDVHVHDHMQRITANLLRPADARDPFGVAEARRKLETAYDVVESRMTDRTWAAGESFSLADCAAAPALYFAEGRVAFGNRPHLAAYMQRLKARPSYARALHEAQPYLHMVPQ